jgi:hypothetical protein
MKCSANLTLNRYQWASQRLVELLPLSPSPYDPTACGMSSGIVAQKEKG